MFPKKKQVLFGLYEVYKDFKQDTLLSSEAKSV